MNTNFKIKVTKDILEDLGFINYSEYLQSYFEKYIDEFFIIITDKSSDDRNWRVELINNDTNVTLGICNFSYLEELNRELLLLSNNKCSLDYE